MNQIVLNLVLWYKYNKRFLPWREISDPYKIWLSEIILQQTQIAQGEKYYNSFIENYPSIIDLANDSEQNVLKLWQGLGYYSRARNLHKTAKIISEKYNGKFPKSYEQLIELKGIGNYTASAILSFSYNLPFPVLDGNVYRVISRFYKINTPINSNKAQTEFLNILKEWIQFAEPKTFNNAIMELGATVCKPENPKCDACPLNLECGSSSNDKWKNYPIKLSKSKPETLYIHYFYIPFQNHVHFVQRPENGIWANLYEFPNIESKQFIEDSKIAELFSTHFKGIVATEFDKKYTVKHLLSHKIIYASFWHVKLNKLCEKKSIHWEKVSILKSNDLPVHKLIENYLLSLSDI